MVAPPESPDAPQATGESESEATEAKGAESRQASESSEPESAEPESSESSRDAQVSVDCAASPSEAAGVRGLVQVVVVLVVVVRARVVVVVIVVVIPGTTLNWLLCVALLGICSPASLSQRRRPDDVNEEEVEEQGSAEADLETSTPDHLEGEKRRRKRRWCPGDGWRKYNGES